MSPTPRLSKTLGRCATISTQELDDAKLDLLVEFERNLDGLEKRLDIALKIRAAVRWQSLRLLGGGKQ